MNNSNLSIEQRITRLEDMESIKQLKAKYARNLDDGFNPEGVASLFVDDGLWTIKGVGGEAKGKAGIKLHCQNLGNSIGWAQHDIFSPIINISSDRCRAEASFYLLCLLTMKGSPESPEAEAVVLSGKYTDKLVKIDGEWYFEEVNGTIEQSSPWTEGWVKSQLVKESW
ncbi:MULTISPECIES: nuclear transport factor 2 family protein [Paraburkholderia]|uniref:nuclear transport factor 2 family protein n=1 Tax=Paraburkholderia TaxID=1822464 RepID=UPI002257EE57|nr:MULTISPECIES: nuclear transport factor 2 family protein [Paraburkholderia]MCX4170844.1 nuclear transport factor 2 family protein [Paraburkholderia madseniana]MDQ6458856.1 nuclear transport factor 2 family protein [Paraburkholderia madseniana]